MEAPSDGFGVHPNWARLDLKEVDKPKSKPKPKMSSPISCRGESEREREREREGRWRKWLQRPHV